MSPVTVEPTAVIALRGADASGVAASADGSVLAVTERERSGAGSVQRRDPRTGALLAAHPAAGDAVIVGFAGSGVWVTAGPAAGGGPVRAQRYSAATMTPAPAAVTLPASGSVRVAGGRLWVTGAGPRDYCADASSGRRLAALPAAGPRRARLLAVAGRVLYYAEPAARGTGVGIVPVPVPAGCG